MKRSFFPGMLLGIILSAAITFHSTNSLWKNAAYHHCAAVWKEDIRTGKIRWMWLDDWFTEQLMQRQQEPVHATPPPDGWTRL